jgi:hypothetical protein
MLCAHFNDKPKTHFLFLQHTHTYTYMCFYTSHAPLLDLFLELNLIADTSLFVSFHKNQSYRSRQKSMDFVDNKISSKKIVVFSKTYCPYCTKGLFASCIVFIIFA